MADKNIIVLASFTETYPNINEEMAAWILDNPGESTLKEFMFELMEELQRKKNV